MQLIYSTDHVTIRVQLNMETYNEHYCHDNGHSKQDKSLQVSVYVWCMSMHVVVCVCVCVCVCVVCVCGVCVQMTHSIIVSVQCNIQ